MTKSVQVEPRCPGCKRTLTDPSEYNNAKEEFEKRVRDVHLQLSRKEKKESDAMLREIKSKHRIEVQRLRSNFRQQEAVLRKKLDHQLKSERAGHKERLGALRRDHQISLQQTRELYETQGLVAQKDREGLFNNQLREIMQNYSNLASNYQKDLERLRKVQDEYASMMRNVESEVGKLKVNIVKSTANPQLARLMVQLDDRDATIDDLRSKVTGLEARLLASTSVENRTAPTPVETPIVPASASPIQTGAIKEKGPILKLPENTDSNLQKIDAKPSEDSNNVDPRELFINAIKEINRNLKRPVDKVADRQNENKPADENLFSGGETIATESGTNADATKVAKFRKWFS